MSVQTSKEYLHLVTKIIEDNLYTPCDEDNCGNPWWRKGLGDEATNHVAKALKHLEKAFDAQVDHSCNVESSYAKRIDDELS
jgi:hypothetical protein